MWCTFRLKKCQSKNISTENTNKYLNWAG
uniref:Uncharacterized protein n=1 Tax=Anguilla anguilla TaxID=7936 RepID=A0A0E9WCG0_ANGAN